MIRMICGTALLMTGCPDHFSPHPAEGEVDAGEREGGPAPSEREVPPRTEPTRDIDILLMVDNSGTMWEEQAALGAQIQGMVAALATGDIDGDGEVDFPPPLSINLGVISSDMGVGGHDIPTCNGSTFGDDGIFQNTGRGSGCDATYPGTFLFSSLTTMSEAENLAADARCIATLGTTGCGFEQPLDAILKSVTPSSSSVRFSMGTRGHGDRMNRGFVRDDSLLVIIAMTDEDDCSTPNLDLFSQRSAVYSGNINLRCFTYPDAVYPTSRYVDGLLALRADRPELLIYAAIVGVPTDLVAGPERLDYDRILGDRRMMETIDPANPTRLRPSCMTESGMAFPPRRMVNVAQQLDARGAGGVVQSICQSDFGLTMGVILSRIAGALRL